ncbi:RecQ family ATP-dependent DNA helicase [Qaidamihabitans albus]|uniref:RecQ family ATP-dependent DNA helicase n=1 Tax=Qaidamihabitans albus TaxID=2795733 RepID=UPI0027DDE918|nr:RecQ family ATP-dependent DNA helicase [Qaidamihabitans albus]
MCQHSARPDPPRDARARLRHTAEDAFGWSRLRPEQLTAMEELLDGRDVLVVMPTGSGKSAIYQVPALLLPGPTVVVSPLIALQRDQAAQLDDSDAPDAVTLNSLQRRRDSEHAWAAVDSGDAEYLFLSPEQLAREDVLAELRRMRPTLFVVDEAHCISAWGHDFRPDYLRLGHVVESLGQPRVLALTATASLPVRDDIVARLGMRDAARVIAGFDRPNLYFEVRRFDDDGAKRDAVIEWTVRAARPGLLYAASRKDTERYARELAERGVRAAAFHAGLDRAERKRVHERFLAGELDVVAATSAFGMGIDKPNVRFVAHASVPESLDSYYQQIGRAGRDGERADAVLFYRPQDLSLQRFLTSRRFDPDGVREVAEAVREHDGPASPQDVDSEVDQTHRRAMRSLDLLHDADVVEPTPEGRFELREDGAAADEAVDRVAGEFEKRRRFDRSRIEIMRHYAETRSCRRRYLLGYFGESLERPCGFCDTCAAGTAQEHTTSAGSDAEFPADTRVHHAEWGSGTVVYHEDDRVTILFDDAGYRTLSMPAVRRRRLLTRE